MPRDYLTRMDSMGQATDTFAALETGVDASTPGNLDIPTDRTKIAEILAVAVVEGAHILDAGNVYTLEVGKKALGAPHEIIVAGAEYQEIGTVASAVLAIVQPFRLDNVDIATPGGNKVGLRAAFGGTDPGTPELYTTYALE